MKTIISDIDGTLIHHYTDENGKGVGYQALMPVKILPGTKEKFEQWKSQGYHIILVTAREDKFKDLTESQLKEVGIPYDVLLTNVPSPRILINDLKPYSDEPTAKAINLKRNQGIKTINE